MRLGIVSFNLFWKASPFIVLLLLNFGLFIPMGWGAPQGDALVVRNSVAIVPSVAGEVIDVPVDANAAAEGRRRPVPDRPDALRGAGQGARSATQVSGPAPVADDATAASANPAAPSTSSNGNPKSISSRRSSRARKWNLDKTIVRAPADGYVTNVALRKGARVANLPLSPVMAFIDTSDTIIGVEIAQNDARYIAPGQPVELTFKLRARDGSTPARSRAFFRRSRRARPRPPALP